MNYLKYLFLLFVTTTTTTTSEKIIKKPIKNINYPSCRNCVYYKPSRFDSDYGSLISNCEKFGEKNVLTGEIKYDYVDRCRNNELKCGMEGKYFEEERNLNIKIFTHLIISTFPNTLLVSVIVFYLLFTLNVYER